MLYIRTQDRMTLVPFDKQISISKANQFNMVFDNSDTLPLGTYKSKERALEVLDEIEQHVLGRMVLPESTYEMREDLAIGSSAYVNVESENIISLPLVYQMPKE